MNKKITIVIIAVILLATIIVFAAMWKAKNNSNMNSQTITVPTTPAKTTDSDVKAIEDDLKEVDENNFNTDGLSDENVGL